MLPIFEVQNNTYNIFDYFNYVFKDKKGIPESSFFGGEF